MASEDELTSDTLDGCVSDVPDFLIKDLKSRLIQYIVETDDFTAKIHHMHGQSAKLVFSLETKQAHPSKVDVDAKSSNTILVRSIPPSVDENLLEAFFESKKIQGGGPVKCVKLFRDENAGFVEFEQATAVQTVMKKRPIKYGQTTLDVQPYSPLLEGNETIGSFDVKGLPKQLTEDILEMHQKGTLRGEVSGPAESIDANNDTYTHDRHVMEFTSPEEGKVKAKPDPSKVRVIGSGIEHGILATFVSRFVVETKGARAGQLTVKIRGPKGGFQVEMYRDKQRDRAILCRYDPTECGLYIIFVKWSGVDVPGSPFHVHILATQEELEQVLNKV